jgi:hypothetical protein
MKNTNFFTNRKTFTTIGSLLLMLVVLFLQSCKKDLTVPITPTVEKTTTGDVSDLKIQNVDVVDGRLAFKSHNDLKAAYAQMFKNQKNLANFEAQFKDFTSQKQAYDKFMEEDLMRTNGDLTPFQDYITKEVRDGEIFYERVVGPKMYSHLVNAEGLLQIKDSVYKFVPGLVYAFGVNDMASYKANKNNLSAIPNVQTINFEVKRSKVQVSNRGILQEVESQTVDNWYERTKKGQGVRRYDGFLTTPNPCCFFAWGAEITMSHKKRGFLGGWYGENTHLRISGSTIWGVIDPLTSVRTQSPTSTLYHENLSTSDLSILLDYNYSGFEYLYFSPTSVTFGARQLNDYSWSSINISF